MILQGDVRLLIKGIYTKYSRLIGNLSSLYILQILNYLLPMITVPYLTRTLGPDKYGIVLFAAATVNYFQILSDYGFNLSATRNVAINKENKSKLNEIFSSVIIIKIMILAICFIFLFLLVSFTTKFNIYSKVIMITFVGVIGNVFFPVWFFQGMEKMKYITYINIIVKTFATALIFVVVKSSNDFVYVSIINSFTSCLVGISCFVTAILVFKIKVQLPNVKNIIKELKDGWHIFTTSFLSNILANSGTFLLGLFCSETIVGYYGALDKIVKAFLSLFSPITQAIYPHINAKFNSSYNEGKNELVKFAKYVLSVVLVAVILIICFSRPIIQIILGTQYVNYANVLRVMSIWIFNGILNNFIGIQYLVSTGKGKYYSRAFSFAVLVTVIIQIAFIKYFAIYSIVMGTVLGEFLLTILMSAYIKRDIKAGLLIDCKTLN